MDRGKPLPETSCLYGTGATLRFFAIDDVSTMTILATAKGYHRLVTVDDGIVNEQAVHVKCIIVICLQLDMP